MSVQASCRREGDQANPKSCTRATWRPRGATAAPARRGFRSSARCERRWSKAGAGPARWPQPVEPRQRKSAGTARRAADAWKRAHRHVVLGKTNGKPYRVRHLGQQAAPPAVAPQRAPNGPGRDQPWASLQRAPSGPASPSSSLCLRLVAPDRLENVVDRHEATRR